MSVARQGIECGFRCSVTVKKTGLQHILQPLPFRSRVAGKVLVLGVVNKAILVEVFQRTVGILVNQVAQLGILPKRTFCKKNVCQVLNLVTNLVDGCTNLGNTLASALKTACHHLTKLLSLGIIHRQFVHDDWLLHLGNILGIQAKLSRMVYQPLLVFCSLLWVGRVHLLQRLHTVVSLNGLMPLVHGRSRTDESIVASCYLLRVYVCGNLRSLHLACLAASVLRLPIGTEVIRIKRTVGMACLYGVKLHQLGVTIHFLCRRESYLDFLATDTTDLLGLLTVVSHVSFADTIALLALLFVTPGSVNLATSYAFLGLGQSLLDSLCLFKLCVCSRNSSILDLFLLYDVGILTRVIHLHLLGILHRFLRFLDTSVCNLLSILAKLLRHHVSRLFSRHLAVIGRRSALAVSGHRYGIAVLKC